MFLFLWNYIRGYVRIQVTGFSVERFINTAAHRGVYLWDVKASQNGSNAVFMNVLIKGFRQLKPCAGKSDCKMRIHKKHGLPFFLHKHRKRKFLAVGILFFIFIPYFFASFIWFVEIDGMNRVKSEELHDFLRQNGVYPGAFKRGLNHREIETLILNNFSDILWINISVNGTKAAVFLTETKPAVEIVDSTAACDIIAKKDGLITNITVMTGTPLVKQGDIVRAGDVLVSGVLQIGDANNDYEAEVFYEYIHAYAEINAKTYYEVFVDIPLEYEENEYTGNVKKEYSAVFFDKFLRLKKADVPYENYEIVKKRKTPSVGENYLLPFGFVTAEYREIAIVTRQRTELEAEAVGYEMISEMLVHEFGYSADIINRETVYELKENAVRATAFITAVERIDETRILYTE